MEELMRLPVPEDPEPTAGVIEPREELIPQQQLPIEPREELIPQQQLPLKHEYILQGSERIVAAQTSDKELIVIFSEADETRATLRRQLQFRSDWVDKEFAFHKAITPDPRRT